MNKSMVNVIILVAGAVLIVLGLQEYGAFGSSVSRAIGRGPSTRALVLLFGGGACTVFGAMNLFKK